MGGIGGDSIDNIDNNVTKGLIECCSNTWDDGGTKLVGEGCLRIYLLLVWSSWIYITNKNIVVILEIIDWFHLHTHISH